jgi:hypothetical protein
MQGSDDFLWRTQGWDEILRQKTKEHPIACFYFNDGRENCDSRIPIVTRGFYEVAGYFPRYFHHFYGDTWVAEIADKAGCLYYAPEVVIEHMHPKFGKSQWDDVYASRGKPDHETWKRTQGERDALVERLKRALCA